MNDKDIKEFHDLDRLKDVGIKQNGHYKLAGYDQLGLWLEHPGITIQKLEDKSGRPLPSSKQKKEHINELNFKRNSLWNCLLTCKR